MKTKPSMKILALVVIGLLAVLPGSVFAAEPKGPQPLPKDAPRLERDMVAMMLGSSVSVRKHGVHNLPAWTGGHNRVPPQCNNGQNIFFRAFEILNDHENMCWRRLLDKDWTRGGKWQACKDLAYQFSGPRISWEATAPEAFAELRIPAGYEKVDLIYTSDPKGNKMRVTIDGKAPPKNALVDTYQETSIPAGADLGSEIDTLDSHGRPRKLEHPKKGISNIIELRAHYEIDKFRAHTLRVQRASKDAGRRILVWGAVYWRGNCIQVVQRAKSGLNCGDLPSYPVIQEVLALKPDYVLMEAINWRRHPTKVTQSLEAGFSWCARQVKIGKFKMLVYATPMASSKEYRKWFTNPANIPPDRVKPNQFYITEEKTRACHQVVIDMCKKYDFSLVDVGVVVDDYMGKNPTVSFIPHIFSDWVHPRQWGAALFGQAIFEGVRKHWPELPVRPINMTPPP